MLSDNDENRVKAIMSTCKNCRYWSELIARGIGTKPIKALCLVQSGPHSGNYTTGQNTCALWAENTMGAVDDPWLNAGRYEQDTV
jgi:hypothetical protein